MPAHQNHPPSSQEPPIPTTVTPYLSFGGNTREALEAWGIENVDLLVERGAAKQE